MKKLSIQTRLMLGFSCILLASLLGPYLYYAQSFKKTLENEVMRSVRVHLELAKALIESTPGYANPKDLNARLVEVGSKTGVRVTYIARGGLVIADSQVPLENLASLDNHATRPELIEARQNGTGIAIRYSATMDRDLVYAATPVDSLSGVPSGMLRVAMPYAETGDVLERMNRNMLGFMGISLLVFFVLTGTLMNRVMSSVRKMVDNVLAIGAGDFQKQIREIPSPEFAPLVKAVNFLAQNIGENITTITRQKVELEAVFNGMREGVMILDDRMRIIGSNHSLQRIFSRLENPTGLTPMEATLVPELQEACQKLWNNNAANNDPRTTSLVIKTQEGAYFDVNIVFLGEEHEDLGAVVVFHDVSEIKRAETLRRDFVGNVSHELRTPLTSIKGYAETLYGLPECGNKDARSFLDIILRNANMMNQMLEDLLALAKYESGEAGLDLRSFDLYSIVYSALKICRPNIREKKLRVDVEFGANEFQVRGDFDQLVQVVVNLVDNAVKYVAEDSGHIRIRAQRKNEMVALAVEDNGSGIPQADQDRVFERFYRVEKHRNRNIPGTGLGLSICRHIVRNHGGSIRLQSPVPGAIRGSVFIVELPTPEKYSGPEGNTE